MSNVENLLKTILSNIVDDSSQINIETSETEKGMLFQIKVAKGDVGKVIGKQGRVASAIRTIVKAAGAKEGKRVMLNVFNKPIEWIMNEENRIKKKIVALYEVYDIYEEDITPDEMDRVYLYYHDKEKALDRDLKIARKKAREQSEKNS